MSNIVDKRHKVDTHLWRQTSMWFVNGSHSYSTKKHRYVHVGTINFLSFISKRIGKAAKNENIARRNSSTYGTGTWPS